MYSGKVVVVLTSLGNPAQNGQFPTQVPNVSGQYRLFLEHAPENNVRRTIHYLGSKLRLVEPIRCAVSTVAVDNKPVCDLFSGSGIVSLALASNWNVTSVDIQEYSRVLCNGILNSPPKALDQAERLIDQAYTGRLRSRLNTALSNLLAYEQGCLTDADGGAIEGLCDLLEHGLLIAQDEKENTPLVLRTNLNHAIDSLQEMGLSEGPETVVTRQFGGRYFSWQQAIDFDALLTQIHLLHKPDFDFYLAAALVTASEIVNTVGKHFAQPIKPRNAEGIPKRHLVKQTLRDRSFNVFESYKTCCETLASLRPNVGRHKAVRADYYDFLENDPTQFAAIYADPPYTRDHYSRYYHVLETMALRDEPDVSTTTIRTSGAPRISRGVYRLKRHQSPFCIPTKALEAFNRLFRTVARRETPLILTYSPYKPAAGNRPRLLTIDQLLEIADRHFANVEMIPIDGVSHNKLNLVARNVNVECPAEVLISCRV